MGKTTRSGFGYGMDQHGALRDFVDSLIVNTVRSYTAAAETASGSGKSAFALKAGSCFQAEQDKGGQGCIETGR